MRSCLDVAASLKPQRLTVARGVTLNSASDGDDTDGKRESQWCIQCTGFYFREEQTCVCVIADVNL